MIDVPQILERIPSFNGFLSVGQLDKLVHRLPNKSTLVRVRICGRSAHGAPIYHIKIGSGRIKALIVGFPHCKEPIGGLTIATLLSLASSEISTLTDADVEWHIIPCIDPDGTRLNEAWMRRGFSLEGYMKHEFLQLPREQVDMSFPIKHKLIHWNRPSTEAKVLKSVIDRVAPDFYFPLHNGYSGGTWFGVNRSLERRCYKELYSLLQHYRVRLQAKPPWRDWRREFARGVWENFTILGFYDYLERGSSNPETVLRSVGAASWEYLGSIKPSALTFTAEVPYVRHPLDGSTKRTHESRRLLKLRLDCDNKFIASIIFEEWENVKNNVNTKSPFYNIVLEHIIEARDSLPDSLPISTSSLRSIIFSESYKGYVTEGERIQTYILDRWWFMCRCYGFVRLLKSSKKCRAITHATRRLEKVFDAAIDDVKKQIHEERFEPIEPRALAAVQLGSGLIAINSLLRAR